MNKTKRLLTLIPSLILTLCMVSGIAACGTTPKDVGGSWVTPEIPADEIVNPPEQTYRVYSVTMQYNDKAIDGGVLSVDKSAGSIAVTTSVIKDEQANGTVTYDSSDKTIATINSDGQITLLKKGETVISATVGTKSHKVVLVVSDDHAAAPASHTITVNGGTSSVTSAAVGEYVTLDVNIPLHKDFDGWRFPNSITWINGNVFKMPNKDVEITAEFVDMLYELNVVGATVTMAGGELNVEGTDGGYTNDGNTAEYAITKYYLPYDTTVDVEAIDEPAGKIFVGWDYGSQDNRAGDLGVTEHSFAMPDETFTVWAIYSNLTNKVMTANFSTKIENGVVAGASEADPAFEGLCGYRYNISAGYTSGGGGYTTENVTGSQLNSIETGTQFMKAIFRNNSSEAVTVELYAAYYGILATTGRVTIEGGETKKVFFTAGMGINNPWMGFVVRENNAQSAVVLDFVLGMAPMYPKGDKSLAVTGGPEYVKLTDASQDFIYSNPFTPKDWARERQIANKVGAIYVANYAHSGCYSGSISASNPSYLTAPIVNMPAYDASNPKGVIYGKYLNLALNDANSVTTTIKLVISATANPKESEVASYNIESNSIGDVFMFKLEWDRVAGQTYYFNIVKEKLDATGTYDANSFCIQMVYNNCIGYEE